MSNEELNTAGKVSVVGHPDAPDGRYNFWKGRDGGWYISQDWWSRYSTYPIGEWFLRKCLKQNSADFNNALKKQTDDKDDNRL